MKIKNNLYEKFMHETLSKTDSHSISNDVSHLGFSLSCEACPQCVQRLANHCSRAGCQAATDEVNSCRLAVIRRRLVDHLGQKLKT